MQVDPWGDERDDQRAAFNTSVLAHGADTAELISMLVGYLPINKAENVVGPEAMRRALES